MGFGMQRQPAPSDFGQQPPPFAAPSAGSMRQHHARETPALSRAPGSRFNPLSLTFNVPFSSALPGPEPADIIHATPGALERWTLPEDQREFPIHHLPVHTENVENLRSLCAAASEASNGALMATVVNAEPKAIPGMQLGPSKAFVTNVCLSGDPDMVRAMRARILNSTPISLVCLSLTFESDSSLTSSSEMLLRRRRSELGR